MAQGLSAMLARWDTPGLASGHERQRSGRMVGGLLALMVVVWAGVRGVPDMAGALGVAPEAIDVAAAACIAAIVLATTLYRAFGLSGSYLLADYFESCVVAGSYAYFIAAAAEPSSVLWTLYLFHSALLASVGRVRRNAVLVIAVPLGIVVVLARQGAWAAALVGFVMGGFATLLHLMLAGLFEDLAVTLRRETALKVQLSELRVTQERTRIARDLHDGVGADLAALAWRLRAMKTAPGEASREDLEAVERRVVETTQQLRDAVLSLRTGPDTWQETVDVLGTRCQELCGGLPLSVEVRDEGGVPPRTLYPEILRVTFELVRNAARHAGASRVGIDLTTRSGGLRLDVTDDGRGIANPDLVRGSGGLGNVHRRVEELGGSVELTSDSRGTAIRVLIPFFESRGAATLLATQSALG